MTTDIWLLVLSLVLVLLAGVLTMAETAIGRVNRTPVEDMRREGSRRAEYLLRVLDDRPRHVNVLLFLSTVARVSATVLGNIRVGDGARVAAASLLLRPLPAGGLAAGSPAAVVGRVAELGWDL